MSKTPDLTSIKHILLDIEGTICPIDFVKQTLFPYAVNALPKVLSTKWDDPEFKPYRDAFPESAKESPEAFIDHVKDLTQRDVKIAYLKNLQGYLWKEGYESGAYSTPLYEDVLPALEKWASSGRNISIYSSGSVFAQKLLFRHISTSSGTIDRQDLISQWFDTTNAGLKHDSESYTKIVKVLGEESDQVLFLSDNVKEIQAARKSGLVVAFLVDRPGNAKVNKDEEEEYGKITSFEQLRLCT